MKSAKKLVCDFLTSHSSYIILGLDFSRIIKMDELRRLLHLIETDDVDEGLNIELKSHFARTNHAN